MFKEFEFEESSLEKEGINPKGIIDFIDEIKRKGIKLHTFTMARNEKIVCKVKGYPYDQDYRHIINSCTKTFTSLAVGICYDRHLINIDDKVTKYIDNPNAYKNHMNDLTIRHLLTMSVGHDVEPYTDNNKMWAERLFDKPLTYPSGSLFFYNNLASHTLSTIVQKVSGVSEYELLKECFFDKCGFKDYYWIPDSFNIPYGAAGLFVRPIDLLKLGQLYLNKGILNGQRIVSSEWVEMATAKQMETAPAYSTNKTESIQGYGFQLWHCTHNAYRASGLFGQVCLVIPDKNIVAVFNSSTTGSQPLLDTFFDTVYPSIVDNAIPENDDTYLNIENKEKILDIEPIIDKCESLYEEEVNNKVFKTINNNKKYSFSFDADELKLTIIDDESYVINLKKGGFASSESDFDKYIMKVNPLYFRTLGRVDAHMPMTYGSYGWQSNAHLKALIVMKDHTSITTLDMYFDDEYITVEEKIEYNAESYTNINRDILVVNN